MPPFTRGARDPNPAEGPDQYKIGRGQTSERKKKTVGTSPERGGSTILRRGSRPLTSRDCSEHTGVATDNKTRLYRQPNRARAEHHNNRPRRERNNQLTQTAECGGANADNTRASYKYAPRQRENETKNMWISLKQDERAIKRRATDPKMSGGRRQVRHNYERKAAPEHRPAREQQHQKATDTGGRATHI